MDFTRATLKKPTIIIDYIPIYWEPLLSTGEKLIALIAIKPNDNTTQSIKPASYIVLPKKRLIAMLGHTKGTSAFGILQQAALFLNERLIAGLALEDSIPPFIGFSVGSIRRSSGWSIKQVLNAAVNSVSAFGTSEEMLIEEPEYADHVANTRTFINRIKKELIIHDESFKDRFHKKMILPNKSEIIIDYSHHDLLVQIASLPTINTQTSNAQREAESKILQMNVAAKEMSAANNKANAKLLINTESTLKQQTQDAELLANQFLDRIKYIAQQYDTEVITATSKEIAIEYIENN